MQVGGWAATYTPTSAILFPSFTGKLGSRLSVQCTGQQLTHLKTVCKQKEHGSAVGIT